MDQYTPGKKAPRQGDEQLRFFSGKTAAEIEDDAKNDAGTIPTIAAPVLASLLDLLKADIEDSMRTSIAGFLEKLGALMTDQAANADQPRQP